MSEKVSRSFYLKKAVITKAVNSGENTKTLKEYLEDVFQKYPKADERRYKLDSNSERFRVMNDWIFLGQTKDVCAASIFAFTLNANQNAVTLKRDEKSYPIAVLAPKRNSKLHQEFVEGLVWFAALDNYVAIMTNQMVSFSMLQEYLSWIIRRTCGETVSISLAEPRHVNLSNCDMANASKIIISNNIEVEASHSHSASDARRTTFQASGRGWNVLKAIYKAFDKKPPKLPLMNENALDQIDVDVIIRARRFKSGTGRLGDAIERLANSFKDVPNPPIGIEFSDGRKISLEEYRVKKTFQIDAVNKIPVPECVCKLLDEWLRTQVGLIESAGV